MKKLLLILLVLFFPFDAFASFEYDGTGDGHVANNPNSPATAAYSVCLWVKTPATFTAGEMLFSYGNGTSSSAGRGFSIQTRADGAFRWNNLDGATNFNGEPTAALSVSTVHHLCFVRESLFQHKLYIDATDATADSANAVDPGANQNSTDDFIVAQPYPADASALGELTGWRAAHVAFWSVALSGAEVASIANNSTCPTAVQAANLKVFMPMMTDPAVETKQALTVTTNGNPVFTASDPTGLPCAVAALATAARSTTLGVGK